MEPLGLNVFHGTWYIRKLKDRYTHFHVTLSLLQSLLHSGCYYDIRVTCIPPLCGEDQAE